MTVVFPGTFDPFTNGHLDLVRRAAQLFGEVVVCVHDRPGAMFDLPTRLDMVRDTVADLPRVTVEPLTGALAVEFAARHGADVIVRGIRAAVDVEYELHMAQMNRRLRTDIETVFIAPAADSGFISASLVRQVLAAGGAVDAFVPPAVVARIGRTPTNGKDI